MIDAYRNPDKCIEEAGFTLEKRFCPACDSFQWHVERKDKGWECLACRVRTLESLEGEHRKKGNPIPLSTIPEPYQKMVRRELRKIPTWKLQEAYGKLKVGEPTGIDLVEQNRAYAISAIEEALFERGRLPTKGSHSSGATLVTTEEWSQAFEYIVPTVSLGVATLSVALGVMALMRSSPLGRRAYQLDGQYLVSVRYPGQWHELREFVQPDNPDVVAIYSQIGPDTWALYDWVARNISYRLDVGEFFRFPSETLAREQGDCEDTSILLASLLKNITDTYVALGDYQGYGHAWCQLNGEILETTYTRARPVPDPEHYIPFVLFDDQDVIELWPGALREVFELGRNEARKLNLMAEGMECILP